MRVASLHTYPIKGCRRTDHDAVAVEPWGLAGDRRWLLVEAGTDRRLSQREDVGLTRIHPGYRDAALVLRTAGQGELTVPAPAGGERVEVRISRSVVKAARAGTAADRWLSAALGHDVWLVWLDDPTQRPVLGQDQTHIRADDRVNFADGHPVLVANSASLAALNATLDEAVPMTRFRPNVVVDGVPAWAEDRWLGRRLRVGSVGFRVAEACGRCVVTTIDQDTGCKGPEPLRMLGQIRRFEDGLRFGVLLVPDDIGQIAVGDEVTVLGD